MGKLPLSHSNIDIEEPLSNFSQCHAGMLERLRQLGELPALLAPAERARKVAGDIVELFDCVVYEHHAEEERELFPAVLRSAAAGEERERVHAMTEALAAQHRRLEQLWQSMAPALRDVEKGRATQLDAAAVRALVEGYSAHAGFEEQQFLPLAHQILSRDSAHMAALGLSLHARHMPTVPGRI